MFENDSRIFKVASKFLKAILFFILVSNASLQITNSLASYEVAKNFSFVSSGIPKNGTIPEKETVTYIERDRLYADFLPPKSSKIYAIEALEKCVLILFFIMDTEKTSLEVKLEGPVDRMKVNVVWLPEPYIYYVRNKGEIQILIANPQTDVVRYRFFVDTSEPLVHSNSKILPVENSQVAFHVDLRKDDRVLLNLNCSSHAHLRIRVFALYYEVFPNKSFYILYLRREGLSKNLYFTADLGGRYYVIVDSIKGEGTFSLTNIITSPPWNQEWFWLVYTIAFFAVAFSLFFLTKIEKIRDLEKATLFALISCYCWFITAGLFISVVGSFTYATLIYMPLFFLLIFSYGFSLGVNLYAAYLDRKKTIAVCPYCGRKVNLKQDNYCCGKIVKNISVVWFLTPLSLSFLFFTVSYFILESIFPKSLATSLWIGSFGSIIGGIVAWCINRPIYGMKSWKFLIAGTLFSFPSTFLFGFLTEFILGQHIELFGRWVSMRVAPLTLPIRTTLTLILSAIGLCYLIVIISERFVFNKKHLIEE